MTGKAKAVLDDLVTRITSEGTSQFIREKLFTDGMDIPCRRWSLLNRFTVSLSGTLDARGIGQWREVGRRIVKGSRAIYIIVPILGVKEQKKDHSEGALLLSTEERESKPVGFKAMPVFRVEDTEGDPLPHELKIQAFDISRLPLIDVARNLKVTVRAGITGEASAYFDKSTQEIILGTENPQTFLHELSHAVDIALPWQNSDYAFSEVVAELSSCFLGSLYGVPVDIGSTKAYIAQYAGRGHVAFKVAEALGRVEEIYHFIADMKKKPRIKAVPDESRVSPKGRQNMPTQKLLIA